MGNRFTRRDVHIEVIDIIGKATNGRSSNVEESYEFGNLLNGPDEMNDIVKESEIRFETFIVEGVENVKTVKDYIDMMADILKTEGRLYV